MHMYMNIGGSPGPTYAGRPAVPTARANCFRGNYIYVYMYTYVYIPYGRIQTYICIHVCIPFVCTYICVWPMGQGAHARWPALPPARANLSRGTYLNVNMYT